MTREDAEKACSILGMIQPTPAGVSIHPEDAEDLKRLGVITELHVPKNVAEKRGEKVRSYRLFGYPVSFVGKLQKGWFYWGSQYGTLVAITDTNGKFVL